MRNWIKKQTKVTADTARKITGVSTPLGGVQWSDPGPSDGDIARRFIVFLEDRRVLYGAYVLEVPSQVHHSIHEIRAECTRSLQLLGSKAFGTAPIRNIRAACRQFQTNEQEDFHLIAGDLGRHGIGGGFFVALGTFRATVGQQVALLAAYYDIDVEGDLASVLPPVENPEEDQGDL
jgi:hypothetical protein